MSTCLPVAAHAQAGISNSSNFKYLSYCSYYL